MAKEEIIEPQVDRYWHTLYIEMQSDPTVSQTDTDFCKDIALDYSTFRAWKVKYRNYIYREVEARRRNYKNEMRSKIYKALMKKMDSDTNAIKLLAQLMGDLVEKTEIKTENMNDGDKVRRIKALSEANSKKLSQWERAEKADSPASTEGNGPVTPESPGSEPPAVN